MVTFTAGAAEAMIEEAVMACMERAALKKASKLKWRYALLALQVPPPPLFSPPLPPQAKGVFFGDRISLNNGYPYE